MALTSQYQGLSVVVPYRNEYEWCIQPELAHHLWAQQIYSRGMELREKPLREYPLRENWREVERS